MKCAVVRECPGLGKRGNGARIPDAGIARDGVILRAAVRPEHRVAHGDDHA